MWLTLRGSVFRILTTMYYTVTTLDRHRRHANGCASALSLANEALELQGKNSRCRHNYAFFLGRIYALHQKRREN